MSFSAMNDEHFFSIQRKQNTRSIKSPYYINQSGNKFKSSFNLNRLLHIERLGFELKKSNNERTIGNNSSNGNEIAIALNNNDGTGNDTGNKYQHVSITFPIKTKGFNSLKS